MTQSSSAAGSFSRYQVFVIAILAFLQFTIILDFMILSPLGAILMPALNISAAQFGSVVSAYAFSAGFSGLLTAGFADRFDRKKLLLFFYTGFVLGTLFCGLAQSYHMLLLARIVTGLFAGVIGSMVFAITTDLFALSMRGRVMGVIQTAFAASQILGLPIGLMISNRWGCHSPFIMIVVIGLVVGLLILGYLRPVTAHLRLQEAHSSPFKHMKNTLMNKSYLQTFGATALLATGGFMLMPFGSAFSVNNLGIDLEHLPIVYVASGLVSIVVGPLIGWSADRFGKFKIFSVGSLIGIATVIFYTHMGITPLAGVILVNVIMFTSVSARMISSSALISAVPAPEHRGSFMSINASLQQVSGGVAAAAAGLIVVQHGHGPLEHVDTLGYVVAATSIISWLMMRRIRSLVKGPAESSTAA